MYYVYFLKSKRFNRKYIECTSDLRKRFEKHNGGFIRSTKAYRPWNLAYYEAFSNKIDAYNREKELKSNYTKKRHLLGRIKYSLDIIE